MDRYDPQKTKGLVVDEWGNWFNVEPGTNPGFLVTFDFASYDTIQYTALPDLELRKGRPPGEACLARPRSRPTATKK